MSKLAQFFKGSDSHFGIFDPNHHVIAIYSDYRAAEHAEHLLHSSGIPPGEAISVPGDDVVQFAEEQILKHGLWGVLMKKISSFFATEEVYAERDLDMARHGTGFVAAHCPTQASKRNVWKLLEGTGPLVARYYFAGGVEHLVGETEHTVAQQAHGPL